MTYCFEFADESEIDCYFLEKPNPLRLTGEIIASIKVLMGVNDFLGHRIMKKCLQLAKNIMLAFELKCLSATRQTCI